MLLFGFVGRQMLQNFLFKVNTLDPHDLHRAGGPADRDRSALVSRPGPATDTRRPGQRPARGVAGLAAGDKARAKGSEVADRADQSPQVINQPRSQVLLRAGAGGAGR